MERLWAWLPATYFPWVMAGNAVSDAFVKNGIKSGSNFFAGMVVSDLTSGIVDGETKKVQEHIKNHGYKSWFEKTQK